MGNFKFRSFLVRILIQKDNTVDKALQTNFLQKKHEESKERIKCFKILCYLRDLSERK